MYVPKYFLKVMWNRNETFSPWQCFAQLMFEQGDQIGRIFAQYPNVYFGQFFNYKSSTHFWAMYFFIKKCYELISTKNVGLYFRLFFTNSSGYLVFDGTFIFFHQGVPGGPANCQPLQKWPKIKSYNTLETVQQKFLSSVSDFVSNAVFNFTHLVN
jgi:hypothetical protein